jgi:Raf kinase inhibitor-like YbhB/YbcL family protein
VPAGTQIVRVAVHRPGRADRHRSPAQIPADQPRTDFTHWAMVDVPPTCARSPPAVAATAWSARQGRAERPGGSRQGLNDYTGWFANDADMRGDWRGYDGPFPPPHDLRLHRYFFRVFALDVAKLDVPERFTASDVLQAMQGHVLGEAAIYGTYSLNPAVKD